MSIKSVMPSNHLILCRPLLLLPSIFSSIRVFSNESALHIRWPKYCSFRFSISPSNEYSGLISFRIDWFDLLAVQGTLKSLLQHHRSKASILQHSGFFYGPTLPSIHYYWENHSFDYMDLCCQVMSLFLIRCLAFFCHSFSSKKQTSFNFVAAVTICCDSRAKENKVYHCFPIYLPWSDGTGCQDLCFLNDEF